MPRKPSSVYVVIEPKQTDLSMPGSMQCWRYPLRDGQTLHDVADDVYRQHPVGTSIVVVEDTKVTTFEIDITLTEVEDARLKEEEDP